MFAPPLSLCLLALASTAQARPFDETLLASPKTTFETEAPKFRRDREVDVERIVVEIEPNLEAQTFKASVTHKFRVLAAELTALSLDARDLDINKVADGAGNSLDFELLEDKLKVKFAKPLKPGTEFSVRIAYSGAATFEGFSFYKPDPRYPGQPLNVWSQGQPETNSRWIPMYDYPNQRAASEMIVIVPDDVVAISNGRAAMKEPGPRPGTTRWHWVQDRPHVSYLIALYIGKFAAVVDKPAPVGPSEAKKNIPIAYWVPPGRETDAKLTFAKTPAMVTFFSDWLAQPYPWERYDQVVNYQHGGGMENTAATNIGDRNLRDRRAMIDEDSDGLIAHELAHQWFGDLITCKDWSHIWLNEAFATFFQLLWTQHDLGDDTYQWQLQRNTRRYFSETESYRRAIVSERYAHPWDVFDGHTYLKGSMVLHMLRREVGEARFQAALRRYMSQMHDKVADTEDLRRAFEDTTGRALTEFFAQWVYGPGHPDLKLTLSYDAREKKLNLHLVQKQKAPFKFKLPLKLSDGKTVTAEASKPEQSFSWDASSRPKWASVDPEASVLAAYELEWPQDMLLAELAAGPSVVGRARAAETLGKKTTPKTAAALRDCLLKDPFWGTASACAETLAKIGGTPALEALRAGAAHKHPKVRRAVAEALASFVRRPEALETLKKMAEDEAWGIQAAALRSIGALRLPEARPILEAKLQADSWNETVRRAALEGLGNLREESVLPLLQEWLAAGKPPLARESAFVGWAKAGEGRDVTWEALTLVLETETDPSILRAAVEALKTLGNPRAIPALIRLQSRAGTRRIHDRAAEAIEALREGRKGRVEELSTLVDGLSKKVEDLEKRLEDSDKRKR